MRMNFFLTILIWVLTSVSLNLKAADDLAVLEGTWMGEMQIPEGPKLQVGLEIFKKADGQWGANVTSMDQGNRYITVSNISLIDKTLRVKLSGGPIEIVATIENDLKVIDAVFKQGEHGFALKLSPVDKIDDIQRKQTPKSFRKYNEEEVSYQNIQDNIWLSGTLTLPKGNDQKPAVMLIAGSGPNHRDSYHAGHRPFMVMADYLTQKGFIVLRSDKRGVYKSTGSFKEVNLDDLANDTQAAVKYLKNHKRVNSQQIYLIGHSEGSVVAAMTSLKEKVAGIVSMAGPGMSILDILLLQDQTEPRAKGASEEDIKVLLAFSETFYQVVLDEKDEVIRKAKLQSLYDNLTQAESQIHDKWNQKSGTLNVDSSSSNNFREFLKQNPLTSWRQINHPVLVLNGDKDSQVPAKINVGGIVNALKSTSAKVGHMILPNLNHMFQNAKTGSTQEYAEIDETLNVEVLEIIAKWLEKQL